MGRKSWSKLPKNAQDVLSYIDDILDDCAPNAVQDIRQGPKKQRALHFRFENWRESTKLTC